MPFSSLLFLHLFLPLFLIIYWAAPRGAKNGVAIGASLVFYAWGAPRFLPVVLGLGLIDYYVARTIARLVAESVEVPARRRLAQLLLGLGVAMHLSILAYFKYSNFFAGELSHALTALGFSAIPWTHVVLPIGVSFITFEEITYLCDVARGDARPARRLSHYLLFLTLFPHSIAGPIFRWKDLEAQLAHREHSLALVRSGFERFSLGLAKKVLVADSVAIIADGCFGLPSTQLTPGLAWLGALAYTIQIYFDFSGYSDMAIGLGRMIGFRLPENFARPYSAVSVTDFWRRWHMSLSRWFRDYLYIPLGGNRKGGVATYRNLVIVFLATGLWHGAAWTFVAWGAYHGALLIIERATGLAGATRLPGLRRLVTFVLVIVGWVLFRSESVPQFATFLEAMVLPTHGFAVPPEVGILLTDQRVVLMALVLATAVLPGTWVTGKVIDGLHDVRGAVRVTVRTAAYAVAPYAAVVAVAGTFSPFLYFQF